MKSKLRIVFAFITAALILAACVTTPEPTYTGDPVTGRDVAQNLCSSCHSIETIGASPNPGAPPLRTVLANYRPDWLAEDLNKSVSISHRKMPTFYFGEHHADDLVAYLVTIQDPPYRDRRSP
jgi:mono/diheme cytochrome c family protein